MLATVMPSPVTPNWLQTSSALMFATPHSTALTSCWGLPLIGFSSRYSNVGYSATTSELRAIFIASSESPASTRIAFVAQNDWYLTSSPSSSARVSFWFLLAAAFRLS
jgi:hypothetical protein